MEFSTVTIAAFVGILNELTKSIAKDVFKKDINRFIPIFSLIYGVALSIIGYNIGNPIDFGGNVVTAVFIGLASGASATGYHQIAKQLLKSNDSNTDITDDVNVEDTTYDETEDVSDVTYDDDIEQIDYIDQIGDIDIDIDV